MDNEISPEFCLKIKDIWGWSLKAGLMVFMIAFLSIMAQAKDSADRIAGQAFGTPAPLKKSVLLLFPSQSDMPAPMLAARAIHEEFEQIADLKIDQYYEYMDLNRFPDTAYKQELFDLYAEKYRSQPVDLVILASELALDLWLEHRCEILPDTPVVFYAVDSSRYAGRHFPADVTGTGGRINYLRSIRWILGARPAVNEIVVVHGAGQEDREHIYMADVLEKELGGQVQVTDLSGLPLAGIKHRVKALPPSSVVLYELMFEDAAGVRYRPIDALRELTAISPVPVISSRDHFIGTGTIGGYMYSIDQQAREAARMGLRILRGEAASAIPIDQNQSSRFIFDHAVLRRFGISLSALPPDSMIKNRHYSMWELYQRQITGFAAGSAVLLYLVAFLGWLSRKLSDARLALTRLNAELENQIQERTASLTRANRDLEKEITERRQLESEQQHLYEHLEISKAFLDSIIEQSPVSMAIYDDKGTLIRINQSLRNLFGIMDDELIGSYNILNNNVIEVQGFMPQVRDVFEKGTSTRFVMDYDTSLLQNQNLPKRTCAVLDATLSAVQAPDGRVTHVIVQHLNITRLQAALTEKEVLLKEVHHRVKNNLQVIASLLEMTRSRSADPKLSDTLADTCARIHSLSIIHNQLYQSSHFDRISMQQYIELLASHLSRVYGKHKQIALTIHAPDLVLSIAQAMPCALVFNELITNSFKHAFQPDQPGSICISVEVSKDHVVSAVYQDDGIGIAEEEMNIREAHTLGMKLIHILIVKQLKGNLRISRNNGTKIIFDFKSFQK